MGKISKNFKIKCIDPCFSEPPKNASHFIANKIDYQE
jgi:hypothetical protein